MKSANRWNFLSISNVRKDKINFKPRKERCKLFALEYLLYKQINNLPINFTSDKFYNVFEDFEWLIVDYDEAKELLNTDDPLNICKRKALARTFHKRGDKIFLTVYIKNMNYPNRDYYTIAHELGHIILGHFIEFKNTSLERGGLTKDEYYVLEREAELFAAELLMPIPVLKKFRIKSSSNIVSLCNVSKSAASIRMIEINHYKITNKLKPLFEKTQKLFNNFIYKKLCLKCNNGFISKNAHYCPICGHNRLIWGDANMIYSSIELNKKYKATKCPVCKNEMTDCNGEYCQICGIHITNKCTNPSCNSYLSGEARFCPFCGSQSTFLANNFLLPYTDDSSKQDYNDILGQETYDNISDEMPF